MEHTSTNASLNGSAYADEVINRNFSKGQAQGQLESEIGEELSTEECRSVAEPYKTTNIIMRGNEQQGFIATLGMYKITEAPVFKELIQKLEQPTLELVIHLVNCMLEAYHAFTTEEYLKAFVTKPEYNENTEQQNTLQTGGEKNSSKRTTHVQRTGKSHQTHIYRDWETDRKSTRLNSSHRL